MLRMTPIADAKRAATYFGASDGGYYLEGSELRREWGGKGASRLGLTGTPELEQFNRLIQGLDPHTGKQLTAQLIEDRIPGWDFTASVPKGVTTVAECGDDRIGQAIWESVRETMAEIESLTTTRVRKGGADADRVTGNSVWMAVEHYETRPSEETGLPCWDRHIHVVQQNLTYDDAEGQWKAVKVRPVFDQRRYFDRCFDSRLAAKLSDLGYGIETKLAPDPGGGGMRYHTWDIKPATGHESGWDSLNEKHSRRTQEVEALEAAIVADRKAGDASASDRLSAVAKDKLGGTSRRLKRKDMTLRDYREHWQGDITTAEREAVQATIRDAQAGANPKPEPAAGRAMEYALAHHFQRDSVVKYNDLEITAMERSLGAARPGDFRREAARLGVLFEGTDATTRDVWEQEQRIVGFARSGRGNFAPLASSVTDPLERLSDEQKAAVRHVWNSSDQIILIRGGAGTGKTTMMTPALSRLGAPVVLLAPSADASRTTLRKEGFAGADTVASFLQSPAMQEQVKGGGIVWVDEAGMLSVNDLERLCDSAAKLGARLVLQGDPKQHKAVDRHGNMLEVLETYAGLPVAKLTAIQRQKGDYAQAVAAIRDGDVAKGDAGLRSLGWVVEGQGHEAIVAEYARAIEETKPDGSRKSVIVIDPTHKDGDKLTEKLRALRKDRGLIVGEEREFARLVPLGWTDAQKSDANRYRGSEVVQFYRKAGSFKPGQRVSAAELLPHLATLKPESFAVFEEKTVSLAVGDAVRFTGNGFDVTKKHRLDNGRIDSIRGFTPKGELVLSNGWVVAKEFGHWKHGLVQTSPATQSKTEDIVLACMNRDSLGAMSAEQAYVSISRGRERGMIFTDLPREELLRAVAAGDARRSATELLGQAKPARPAHAPNRMRQFMEKVRATYRQIQAKAKSLVPDPQPDRELSYGR